MKCFVQTIGIVVLGMLTAQGVAAEEFKARAKLWIHTSRSIADGVELRTHVIPLVNLADRSSPTVAYLGVNFKTVDWFDIEVRAGLNFNTVDPRVGLVPKITLGSWTSWSLVHISQSLKGYWYSELCYALNDWMQIGLEGEGWGKFGKKTSWSHGIGPVLTLKFSKRVKTSFAVHRRTANDVWGNDLFLRIHLFL